LTGVYQSKHHKSKKIAILLIATQAVNTLAKGIFAAYFWHIYAF
jgi:hypothetical protein